ncbi:MAG: TROVE domain-containing protein, partial [Chloroflexota bacterium]|nr:TROVE domain-containing protein [Chloroflexota bacterium]
DGGTPGLTPLKVSPRQRLDDVLKAVDAMPMGGTDCALPMLWAQKQKIAADVFVVYTDSETWAGKIHPTQALRQYRQATGIAAKLIVVGMVSNGFTIADPDDAGMMDVVGFDTAAPQVMADFAVGL